MKTDDMTLIEQLVKILFASNKRCRICNRLFTAGSFEFVSNTKDSAVVKISCAICGDLHGTAIIGIHDHKE